ncbi:MAG: histidine--tRNA ligase [Candidatus Wildermuthbacteria bacterium RIFCSPHIGHO2_02_FULL_49_9]|uniref:Histidine--tRNA ligase n=1 Tax=Candidatus Wildermuthbacteria bacterium RIFCSPHIGHO2_02_FULL_49_9 TaxID=1802456 RepID=A0A1G2RFZ6_9BACT|nr:MAG: histidine--tRNA ligase [Candidatus Wildermuthbacteria bacterium RIFCSPHIGHO2_02_FULL_49_9]
MAKKPRFQRPTGMRDILPEEQPYFEKIYRTVDEVARFYGFGKIDTPIVEDVELYERGTGQSTDIVEKQMYSFKTRGGDALALRPEFTPGIVRAYNEHGMLNLPQPVKLYACGPLFRYEHPQAGRYRQFHQVDFEVFGEESAAIDAQVIQIFYTVLKELKFGHLICEVNSIGDTACRPYYKKVLTNFLRPRQNSLCADCKRRTRENPLRVLDCKEEKCQRLKAQAPQILDHLCEQCKSHFKSLLEFLDEADLPYHLDPYLVRGLDYYTKTVFEIFSETAVQEQKEEVISRSALVGGGRYDSLVRLLGGKDVPATGAAAGVERIIAAMKERGFPPAEIPGPKVFLAQLGDLPKKRSLKLLEELRKAKIPIAESLGRDSLRTQLARADKLEVEYTLILGQREVLDGAIVIRKMDTGEQQTVKMAKVIDELRKRLSDKSK